MASSVYVSYNWPAEVDSHIVEKLKAAWQARGIDLVKLKIDKQAINYGDSVRAFMDELTQADSVIMVLSEAYFKSPNCMYELRGLSEHQDFRKRVSLIVLRGTPLYDPLAWVKYRKYWEEKVKELDEALKTIGGTDAEDIYKRLNEYDSYRRLLAGQLAMLADMNALTQDIHVDTDFEALLTRIQPKPAEQGDKPRWPRKPDAEFQQLIKDNIRDILAQCGTLQAAVQSHSQTVFGAGDPLESLCQAEPTTAITKVLRPATKQCLRSHPAQSDDTWAAAKSILGWLSLFSVSPEWIDAQEATQLRGIGFEIMVKTQCGVEIVSSRFRQIPPLFHAEPGTSDVYGQDAITFPLETGWSEENTLKQIMAEIWYRVFPKEPRQTLSPDDIAKLNSRLKIRELNKENHYYIPVREGEATRLADPAFCQKLLDQLKDITIIRLSSAGGKATLQVEDEYDFMTVIHEFLTTIPQQRS